MTVKNLPLQKKWADIEYFENSWNDRVDVLASMLSKEQDTVVLDLGCGMQYLRKILPSTMLYVPVDYTTRSPDTVLCNFNNKEFPEVFGATAFISGCLEYIEDVSLFVSTISKHCSSAIISYCDIENFSDLQRRRNLAWTNDLSKRDIITLFAQWGMALTIEIDGPNVPPYACMRFDKVLTEDVASLIAKIHEQGLSYLGLKALTELATTALKLCNEKVEGHFLEAGCALGGSAIVLAATKGDKQLFVYDVFGLIPPPSENDGNDVHERYATIYSGKSVGLKGGTYYGYEENLLEKVKASFTAKGYPPHTQNIHFIKGVYEKTLFCDVPIALAHVDCDWYDSVKICLERIAPHVVTKGHIVIDDYQAYSGCRTAVEEFLYANPQFKKEQYNKLHLVRI